MKRLLIATVIAAGLPLAAHARWVEKADPKAYEAVPTTWHGHQAGVHQKHEMDVMVRRFDRAGRLAVCAYYLPESGLFGDIQDRWIKSATLEAGSAQVSARFIPQLSPQHGELKGNAGCVELEAAFTGEGEIKIDGPPVQMDY